MSKRLRSKKTIHRRNVNALIFIDANQYLELYRITKGKKLLEALNEQQDYIFLTKQICDEVQRNKLQVAAEFFTRQFEEIRVRTFEMPDPLLDVSTEAAKNLVDKLKSINEGVKAVNKDLPKAAIQVLCRISQSEDEVSKGLSTIFSRAVLHEPEELERARQRKELGNPPGKKAGPLGDQLNWEQLLSHCKNATTLWIVTKDSDYCTRHCAEMFLNPMLYQDIAHATSRNEPAVFCFDSVADALRHFVSTTGVKAERLPTAKESKEIKEEIASLPPIDFLSTTMNDAANAVIQSAYAQQRQNAARIAAAAQDSINRWLDEVKVELK